VAKKIQKLCRNDLCLNPKHNLFVRDDMANPTLDAKTDFWDLHSILEDNRFTYWSEELQLSYDRKRKSLFDQTAEISDGVENVSEIECEN